MPMIFIVNLRVTDTHFTCPQGTRSVCSPPCTVLPSTNSSAGGVITKLRVGCLKLRGLKSNSDYLKMILGKLNICGISEHWLHHYGLSLLPKFYSEFFAYSTCSKPEEDVLRCTPRSLRGNGRVSILWHKSLALCQKAD